MTLTCDFVTGQTVTFQRMRKLLFDQGGGIQEGVVNSGDLMVTQRGAGANMSVDVATGFAWAQIDTGTNNGLAHITNDAIANIAVTAAHATLPRIDQLILRYNDTAIPTGAGNTPTLEVLTGTATAGATTTNRLGATALPNDCARLADFVVPAASSSVVNTNIRDRRQWARGAYRRVLITAGNYTITSTAVGAAIDTTNLSPRVEVSGTSMVRLQLTGAFQDTTASIGVSAGFNQDGVGISSVLTSFFVNTANQLLPLNLRYDHPAPGGSHLYAPTLWGGAVHSTTLAANVNTPLVLTIEEIVRQDTANNTVTSG